MFVLQFIFEVQGKQVTMSLFINFKTLTFYRSWQFIMENMFINHSVIFNQNFDKT